MRSVTSREATISLTFIGRANLAGFPQDCRHDGARNRDGIKLLAAGFTCERGRQRALGFVPQLAAGKRDDRN